MIYIVSGFMRSGTSMMMKALEAGGMDAAYDPVRNDMNARFGDEYYTPNAGGFYELNAREYKKIDFPEPYEGRLIKCLMGGMIRLPAGDYKVVFMHRPKEEITDSYHAFFNRRRRFDFLDEQRERIRGILDVRSDMDVVDLNYSTVVQHPRKSFKHLADRGWDIDVDAAAAVVDPDQYRFKS